MIRRLGFAIALAALAAPAFAAGPGCTIFQHRGFGGAHWFLHNGDDMLMIQPPELGTSDGIHRFIYKADWNDQVSSVKVSPGCTLTMWEDVNKGGAHFTARHDHEYLGDNWNDRVSEAECTCPGGANY